MTSNQTHANTGCQQKNTVICFLSIVPSNLYQSQQIKSVLISACPDDFKTILEFQFGQVEAEILRLEHTRGYF